MLASNVIINKKKKKIIINPTEVHQYACDHVRFEDRAGAAKFFIKTDTHRVSCSFVRSTDGVARDNIKSTRSPLRTTVGGGQKRKKASHISTGVVRKGAGYVRWR